ncbi:MAG: UDP-2,3-diacylglucosamine diphosphatase [Gammaproteobacteria bacterium]|nr:UDP-2,3-diacylglucosamine diphosphatase [Gammaproteobacteria bacterium]
MTTLFISDLHLTPRRPEISETFHSLLRGEAQGTDAVYILGDLFEYWIGDDAAEQLGYGQVLREIRALSDSGVPVYFMRGNRDFLIGDRFAADTGCGILPDPAIVDLYGEKVLLTHGDYLCTDDIEHQSFRRTVDDPAWRRAFLNRPVEERMRMAQDARKQSREHKDSVDMEIMDVNGQAVRRAFAEYGVRLMIHGHTHRPAIHDAGETAGNRRIVLGAWYEQSSILRCSPGVQELDPAPGNGASAGPAPAAR